jgi:hypothetical protein
VDALFYRWDLDGDGQFDDAHTATVSLTWPQLVALGIDDDRSAAYPVSVQVADNSAFTNPVTAASSIVVTNVAPSPQLSIAVNTGVEGSTIQVAAVAGEPGLDTLAYEWIATRDGVQIGRAAGSGVLSIPAFSFVADNQGVYAVELVVTDDDGGVGRTATTPLAVRNQLPTLGDVPASVRFTQGSSYVLTVGFSDPGAADVWRAELDLGNGVVIPVRVAGGGSPAPMPGVAASAATPSLEAVLGIVNPGSYDGTLRLYDDGGMVSRPIAIQVDNAVPVVDAQPDARVVAGRPFSRTISFADVGLGPWSYSIDWGDGSPATVGIAAERSFTIAKTYAPSAIGRRTVSVVVNDGSGDSQWTSSRTRRRSVSRRSRGWSSAPASARGPITPTCGRCSATPTTRRATFCLRSSATRTRRSSHR